MKSGLLKKITAVLLCTSMVFSAAACGSGGGETAGDEPEVSKQAADIYMAAGEKMSGLESFTMDINVASRLTSGEDTVEVPVSGAMQYVLNGGSLKEIEYFMDMTTETMGVTADMDMYYRDGVMYIHVESGEESFGMKMTVPEDQLGSVKQYNSFAEISADMIKSASVEGDTEKKVTMVVQGDRISDFAAVVSGETETGNTPSVGDMTFEFTVNEEGYLKDMHMLFDMTYVEGSGETVYSYDMTMVYTGYNNVDAIEYPDFSDYVDITEEELAL
ncbi:MAG: hypothetical protein Q4C14_02870 [Bacillota bacterium]|nr:hypothetical protein [Bacillota bacterium]